MKILVEVDLGCYVSGSKCMSTTLNSCRRLTTINGSFCCDLFDYTFESKDPNRLAPCKRAEAKYWEK